MKIVLMFTMMLLLFACEDNSTASNPWDGIDGVWRVTGEEPHLQGFKATKSTFTKAGILFDGSWTYKGFEGRDNSEMPNIHILSRTISLYISANDSLYGKVITKKENEHYAEYYDTVKFTAKRVSDF